MGPLELRRHHSRKSLVSRLLLPANTTMLHNRQRRHHSLRKLRMLFGHPGLSQSSYIRFGWLWLFCYTLTCSALCLIPKQRPCAGLQKPSGIYDVLHGENRSIRACVPYDLSREIKMGSLCKVHFVGLLLALRQLEGVVLCNNHRTASVVFVIRDPPWYNT